MSTRSSRTAEAPRPSAATFFDAHVHVYPEYDLDVLLSSLASNARRLAPQADCVAAAVMLREFQPGLGVALEAARAPREWRIEPPDREGGHWRALRGGEEIALLPARQVATRERLELLGYFGEAPVPDGMPLRETAYALSAAGYCGALAWGRGKWLFRRGRLVKFLLRDPSFRTLAPFVCDSALRPPYWPEPLFLEAEVDGFSVLAGSDPLPGAGRERAAGRYATLVDAPLDCILAAASFSAVGTRPLF